MDVYLVGGAVRDRLLGLQPKERDWVVVGANEQQMRALGYRRVGRDFPVFLHPDTNEQYALARTERKSGHGYTGFVCDTSAEVTLEDDLRRRDLTINAIAQDAQGGLTDPFGGQRDLELRVLRHVSEAFVEDPLRVLRVARFAARLAPLGFTVAPETMALMRQLSASGELDYLVAERVWVETQNALGEPAPQEFVRVLRDCGALAVVFPEIDRLFGVPQPARHHPEVDTGAHLLLALQMAARLELSGAARFAVLTHDLGKALTPPEQWPAHIGHEKLGADAVKQLCDRLGVPAKWRSVALKTCLHHTRCHRALELRASTIVDLLGDLDAFRQPEQFEECLRACEADARGRAGLQERAYVQADHLRGAFAAASAVGTADILERGISGPRVGEELRRLRIAAVNRALGRDKDEHP